MASVRASKDWRGTRSILFIASTAFRPDDFNPSTMRWVSSSSDPGGRRASTNITIRSASAAPVQAASTMAFSKGRFGAKIPGVSTKMIWAWPAMEMPIMRVRVVWTLGVTIATFEPTMALSNVDLPAFGAPSNATYPHRVCSTWSGPVKRSPPATSLRLRFVQPPGATVLRRLGHLCRPRQPRPGS